MTGKPRALSLSRFAAFALGAIAANLPVMPVALRAPPSQYNNKYNRYHYYRHAGLLLGLDVGTYSASTNGPFVMTGYGYTNPIGCSTTNGFVWSTHSPRVNISVG